MTVKINLKKAERKVLPEGDYLCTIVTCEEGETREGNPKIHTELVVADPNYPEFEGVKLYHDPSLKEQSWFKVVELYEAAKGEPLPENEDGDFSFDPEDLVGDSVLVSVVVDNSYDNTDRNKVVALSNPEEIEEEVEA